MTFSEDPATPAAPFTGDGSIFDHPDVLLQAPMTQERVVDTQSGFLVVIKRMGEMLALSCKRRVGTPPISHVLLTPDESLKLSRILAGSAVANEFGDSNARPPVPRINVADRKRFAFNEASGSSSTASATGERALAKPVFIISALAVAALLLLGGFTAGHVVSSAKQEATMANEIDPLSPAKIDKFARTFVSDMLDFNPTTYKISQVQAMSYMSPELLEKYWQETNFPLSRRQLKTLPQGTTVQVNKIVQGKGADDGTSVEIYADLVRSESKSSNPVHIKLKLGLNEDGGIRVLEQEDLTATASGNNS